MNVKEFAKWVKENRPYLDRVRYINSGLKYYCYSTNEDRYIELCQADTITGGELTIGIYYPSEYDYDIWCKECIDNHDLFKLRRDYKNLLKGDK